MNPEDEALREFESAANKTCIERQHEMEAAQRTCLGLRIEIQQLTKERDRLGNIADIQQKQIERMMDARDAEKVRAEKAESLLRQAQFEFLEADRARETAEAACAEMRMVLDNIWDRDELGKSHNDPDDQPGCSECPECEAHLPHGRHAESCITGQVFHALSSDCGKGHIPALELDKTIELLNYLERVGFDLPKTIAERNRLEALRKGK